MRVANLPLGSRNAAVGAAGIGAVTDVAYLLLTASQESGVGSRVAFYAAFVALMSALSLAGALGRGLDHRFFQLVLYAAAAGFVLAGFIGLASVGLPLILAGFLASVAAGPRRVSARLAACPVLLSAAAFIVGLALT